MNLEETNSKEVKSEVDESEKTSETSNENVKISEDEESLDEEAVDVLEEEEEVVVVSFGDDEKDDELDKSERESSVMRDLRRANREKEKALKKMQRELEELKAPAVKKLRPEPNLEDHDYDDVSFKQDMKKWLREEAELEKEKSEAAKAQEIVKQEHQEKVRTFQEKFTSLPYKDKEDAFQEVVTAFNEQQQSVILDAVDNPDKVVYALGKTPKELERLSKIKNLVRLSAELAKIEAKMKFTMRKPKTSPDTPIRGSGGVSAVDKTREKLLEEARRTKNRSKLIAYDKKMNAKKG